MIGVISLAGCGDPLVRAELTDLRKQLDETRGRAARAAEKAESLEDRLFLLTDRIESAQIASARPAGPPKLPVITLRPEDAPAEGDGDIVYEGDARSPSPDRARPLVLEATPSPRAAPRKIAAAAPMVIPTSGQDNLGVAPAPPVRAANPGRSPIASAPDARVGAPESRFEKRVELSESAAKIDLRDNDPAHAYKVAYDLLRAGQHDAAAERLRAFVKRFPHHDFADNAQYWLGEAYYDRKRYAEAALEFRTTVEKFPSGNKAPDALVKLGYCLLAMGEQQKGREVLARVSETYPNTEAARLASDRLAELH